MTLSPEQVAEIAEGLTKAQQEALVRIDERVYSLRELHHRTFAALFRDGIAGDLRAAGHRFFAWTELGRAIRHHLQGQS